MKVNHPDSDTVLFMQPGTKIMAELEIAPAPGWITIGYMGVSAGVIIDHTEWDAFVALVNEVDATVKSNIDQK